MAVKLTDAAIKRMRSAPPGKRLETPDALAPGLVLRINEAGRRDWQVRYRLHGKQAKLALGQWPAVGLGEARELARQVREQAAAGIDPKLAAEARAEDERRAVAAAAEARRTFRDLAESYVERETPRLAQGAELASLLRREVIPDLGDVPLVDFRRRHAVRLLDRLVDERKPALAHKVAWLVARIFRWAIERDEIEMNPVDGLKAPVKPAARERTLKHAEIAVLWQAWGHQGYPLGDLQRLLIITGQRRSEVATMTWSEIDDPERPAIWTIPAGKAKNGREHRVPLSGPARDLLSAVPRFTGPHVFTSGDGARPVSGFSKAKTRADALAAEIAKRAGVDPPEAWTWHDLRRTCRTELARLGVSDEVGERVLNHAGDGLVRVYNRFAYEREIADALERWGAELQRIVGEAEPAGAVVALAEARR